MTRRFGFAFVVLAAVLIAACGSSSKSSSGASSTTSVSPTTAYSYGGATSPTTAATSGAAVLKTAMNAKLHQIVLVDQNGKTVYIYKPNGTSTTSKVPAALKAAWPAVTSKGSATSVATGLDDAKAKVNAQDQVSYNGQLLYTFRGDTKPGEANGQGLGKVWYVLGSNGTPIT